ncbi:MAG: type III pantothenate kinase [Gammaproteobacteria bacterium]|nr:type III pantothenate kinase [Gammaproteobacteria bacterium]
MIALLDLGNSRFKLAPFDRGQLGNVSVMQYGTDPVDSVVRALWRICPKRVYMASVRGAGFNHDLSRILRMNPGIVVKFVQTPESGFGVRIAYRNPSHLGVDRFLSMVAVRRALGTAAIVLDCGTAVTVDALDVEGRHLGGLIFPGLQLMRSSLNAGAAEISVSGREDVRDLFASDTIDGVLSGTTRAMLASLEKISSDMRERMRPPISTVIDGGDADYLAPNLSGSFVRMRHLVLRGLAVLVAGE